MHILFKIAIAVAINALAIFVAERFVSGFVISADSLLTFLILTLIFTLLNFTLKPILKLLLGPLIILTLGLGAIIVNAVILKLLDFLSPALSIQGLVPLLIATILISFINFIFHFATRTSS